jgi:D-aminopeptidase
MRRIIAGIIVITVAAAGWGRTQEEKAAPRPRARELGIKPGIYEPGPDNAITDVVGVRVGQVTIHEDLPGGKAVRTGVTAILPHDGNVFREKVAGAVYVFNAFGKLVGSTQVNELGQIETPILLTNTLSVWDAAAAMTEWMLALPGNENVRSINPVVGETNDGYLNDIRGRHVKAEHVRRALESAKTGPVEEGSVGAGAGTVAFGWKGGIGTSSRSVPFRSEIGPAQETTYTIGVLVQTNFGGRLTMDGVPVWRTLAPSELFVRGSERPLTADGSCMIVVGTDAPLDARQLHRLAARAMLGMARTGSTGSHGSGDFVIAFSTTGNYTLISGTRRPAIGQRFLLSENDLSRLFEAVVDSTEEAIYNSLLKATTVKGEQDHIAPAIPIDALRELLKKYGRSM